MQILFNVILYIYTCRYLRYLSWIWFLFCWKVGTGRTTDWGARDWSYSHPEHQQLGRGVPALGGGPRREQTVKTGKVRKIRECSMGRPCASDGVFGTMGFCIFMFSIKWERERERLGNGTTEKNTKTKQQNEWTCSKRLGLYTTYKKGKKML